MEELTLTTPSILFSAISLIMLAYTNRFLAYASVIRNLKKEHESNPSPITQQQMDNLRRRLHMTRSMQIYGVSSLLLCVVCTLLIYIGLQKTAVYTFGAALGLLVVSLWISIRELLISVRALEVHLDHVDEKRLEGQNRSKRSRNRSRTKKRPGTQQEARPASQQGTVANQSTGGTSINSTRASLNARSEKSDMRVTPSPSRRPRVVPAISTLPSTTNT